MSQRRRGRRVDATDSDALDEPRPPGGPNRSDAAEGHESPGTPARDPGTHVNRVTRREGSHPAPAHDHERPEQSEDQAHRQQENAEESGFGEPSP